MMRTHDLGSRWHQTQLGRVDEEIARLAAICDIRMLDPGVIERVIRDDETVCGRSSKKAFRQLRALVKMHYALTADSLAALGPEESARIVDSIRTRLRARYDLGGGR
jgi:hypothetical protein